MKTAVIFIRNLKSALARPRTTFVDPTDIKPLSQKPKIFLIFLKKLLTNKNIFGIISKSHSDAGMAQSVEHVIGNDEVISSILITSSKK